MLAHAKPDLGDPGKKKRKEKRTWYDLITKKSVRISLDDVHAHVVLRIYINLIVKEKTYAACYMVRLSNISPT